ncbi:right-handed parallel beta-helix repeat-containing protein [Allorhodopirellula heiligendammensis]|uniref:Pectate lyase L n=1 Tax=Allorhodopirellula heiligendammensis TaxID=2714739 RepID=A0A5C6BG13_9BACT|nr:right-handed parallel beta-helix repeat-containing protein [Allorhodopirellula heiligendammensis]TWU11093.1 Pectate lyase L precursor [Allorhodopirellula heiligendammensis]
MKFMPRRGIGYTLMVFLAGMAGVTNVAASEFYVATDGDDNQPGTLEQPFASIHRAQEVVGPGDTVFVRGGTYHVQESQISRTERIWAYVTWLHKSGTPDNRINYWAYQDEQPVFDFSEVRPRGKRVHAFEVTGSWIHLRGLEVVGVQVTIPSHTQSICFANNGSHNIFEQLSMHDGHAIGIYSVRGSDNLFLNCDAYRNDDPVSEGGRGGNVDGFGCHPTPGSTGNVFRGCRAWFNSDDGFDCISASESVTFEHCWAFWNGYSPGFERRADGNGFKAGGYGSLSVRRLPSPIPRHRVQFCVAAKNKNCGFYANHHIGGVDWFNNTAFRNGANFNFLSRLPDNVTDVPGYGHRIKNNLSFGSRNSVVQLNYEECELSHNSFDIDMELSEKDFVGLDESQLAAPRQTNGELPRISLLHLTPDSPLVDAGVDIGFPFHGQTPDCGAFEFVPSEG